MDELPPAPSETVSVEFSLAYGGSQISATAEVPTGRTNLTQILPILQSLGDSLIGVAVSEVVAAGRTISCKAGCGACCRQLVPISVFEAEALAAWVRTLPESQQQELGLRFDQTLRSLAAGGILERLVATGKEFWDPDNEAHKSLAIEYHYQRVPCPFLVDEACSIHPIRPLICREYLVTSSPEHCVDPATRQTEMVPLPIRLMPALNQIGAEVEHNTRGWIPLVFLFAWMKADAHPGEKISGTGPEVLYKFLRRIRHADGNLELPEEPPPPTAEI
ncbi:MAG: YkgJ family cysteine cluster protein [Terracidiphilus sp.]|jgi:Fe-S-cluster containining protein